MPLKIITNICLCCFLAALFLNSCSPKFSNPSNPENYHPIYKDNGGKKITTFINKNKVQTEKEFMALLRTIIDLTSKRPTPPTTENISDVDITLLKAINETEDMIRELERKIRAVNVQSADSHEQILKYMKELNDLLCTRIGAINKFLKKRVSKIYADVSFKTGSSFISPLGISQLEGVSSQIIKDVEEWRSYVNDCNEKIFENDLFVLVINIDGYADQQGSTETNISLSSERAVAVKKEMLRQLGEMVTTDKINVVFDKIHANGHGEDLPPGVPQKGKNDPGRRICLISSIVGPSALLKN